MFLFHSFSFFSVVFFYCLNQSQKLSLSTQKYQRPILVWDPFTYSYPVQLYTMLSKKQMPFQDGFMEQFSLQLEYTTQFFISQVRKKSAINQQALLFQHPQFDSCNQNKLCFQKKTKESQQIYLLKENILDCQNKQIIKQSFQDMWKCVIIFMFVDFIFLIKKCLFSLLSIALYIFSYFQECDCLQKDL